MDREFAKTRLFWIPVSIIGVILVVAIIITAIRDSREAGAAEGPRPNSGSPCLAAATRVSLPTVWPTVLVAPAHFPTPAVGDCPTTDPKA